MEKQFEGKMRAEWFALRGKSGLGSQPDAKVEEALLWFASEDSKARHETEERRFQTQLTEMRRQGSLTRRIAWLALVVAACSLAISILTRYLPVPASSAQIPQRTPPLSPQKTKLQTTLPA